LSLLLAESRLKDLHDAERKCQDLTRAAREASAKAEKARLEALEEQRLAADRVIEAERQVCGLTYH
jgi:hypothetical protein